MTEAEREAIIRAGYRAAPTDDCPYPEPYSNEYILWMRGRAKHINDRERVRKAASETYCRSPLRVREWTSR